MKVQARKTHDTTGAEPLRSMDNNLMPRKQSTAKGLTALLRRSTTCYILLRCGPTTGLACSKQGVASTRKYKGGCYAVQRSLPGVVRRQAQ